MRSLKKRTTVNLGGESLTEQAHANDADINQIMAKAIAGQHSDYIKTYAGSYGDTTSHTFLEANIIVANATQMFDALPSRLRNKFDNKPEKFLEFVQNPDNIEEMYELKLAKKPNNKPPMPPREPPATKPKTPPTEPQVVPPTTQPTTDKE